MIVAVDEPSLARHGQWPWPRQLLADLVARIETARPAAIGLDLLFPEPDRFAGPTLAARLARSDPAVAAWLRALPDGDRALAAALAAAPSVIGMGGLDGPAPVATGRFTPVAVRGGDPLLHVRRYVALLRSVPVVDDAARGHALLSAEIASGVVRRLPLAAAVGETLVPGLSVELLRVAAGAAAFTVDVGASGVDAVSVSGARIPTEADGTMWIRFTPHDPARFVSASAVLAGEVGPEVLERRLVLIGATALGLVDQHATPLGERVPGVEIHAQALENVFDRQVLVRPRAAPWSEAGVLLLAGGLLVVLVPGIPPIRATGLIVLLVLGCLGASFLAYRELGWLLDGLTPALGLGLVYTVMLGGTLAEADAQRRALRQRLQEEREAAARLAGELEAARRIQLGLLPRAETAFPGEARIELAAVMEPARVVGGDLYDFFRLGADHVMVLVGDVSGKGLPASLFMAATKALYRSLATQHGARLGETMQAANAEIGRDNPEAFFVTLGAAVLDARTGQLRYCSAGHEPPWLLGDAGGAPRRLADAAGPPLCVLEDFAYEMLETQLAPGDTLLIVSDGVTEALDSAGRLFGADRVTALVTAPGGAHGEGQPARLVARVTEAVAAFRGPREPADDVTVLALRWHGPDPGAGRAGPPVSGR